MKFPVYSPATHNYSLCGGFLTFFPPFCHVLQENENVGKHNLCLEKFIGAIADTHNLTLHKKIFTPAILRRGGESISCAPQKNWTHIFTS